VRACERERRAGDELESFEQVGRALVLPNEDQEETNEKNIHNRKKDTYRSTSKSSN
jgi:hypothetical protein